MGVIWDNASWHLSREVHRWFRRHNQQVKRGARYSSHLHLSLKSPWLGLLAPYGVHGKQAIVEPSYLLTAAEVIGRVCDYCETEHCEPLQQKVA
jgi:hypothetical protein